MATMDVQMLVPVPVSLVLLIVLYLLVTPPASAFAPGALPDTPRNNGNKYRKTPTVLQLSSGKEEAERLLAKSKILREEIAKSENAKQEQQQQQQQQPQSTTSTTEQNQPAVVSSKWAVAAPENPGEKEGVEYRLYVDIGREVGSWMDPRWGASGRRIEFSLDVRFLPNQRASNEAAARMVQDNKGGKRSPTFALQSAPFARLRQGFDEMKCSAGAYRIDRSRKPGESDTLRFYVMTEGTPEENGSTATSYGDVSIPAGGLYFSIPCFGGSVNQISRKGEMPVTVRQMGWHTGWRREESRIVGIFKAWPIEAARNKDRF